MITATTPAKGGMLAAILVLAAGCWAAAIWHMNGMDMGTATALGSFGSFVGLWVPMMAAMMLPGAVPAVLRVAHGGSRVGRAAIFLGSYLSVWALVGSWCTRLIARTGRPWPALWCSRRVSTSSRR